MRRFFYLSIRTVRDALRAGREYVRPMGPFVFRKIDLQNVTVRPVTEDAIEPLEVFLTGGDFAKHRERLRAQKSGVGEYLIAWHVVPIGHVFIIWQGGSDGPLARMAEKEPFIEDLFVHPVARRRGIGKKLMDEAEDLIRKKGHRKVGLTIGTNNPAVEEWYRKRGFEKSSLGAFVSRRIFRDKKGRERTWSAEMTYWVKVL